MLERFTFSIFNFILDSYPISVSAEGISCIIEGIYDVAYLNLIYPNNIEFGQVFSLANDLFLIAQFNSSHTL